MTEHLTLSKQANPFARNHLIRDAISQAIHEEMGRDPSIYMFGEGAWVKQKYDAPKILADFPNRIVTMPICEDGMTNFAVGASLLGVKPVVDIISADFLFRAMDSICNTAAKLNFVRPNEPPRTIVIRAETLLGGPTTGQRIESLFTHIPGLNVIIPSTPRDAYGLMLTALRTPGVTLFFEDRMIRDDGYWSPDELELLRPLKFGRASCTSFGAGVPLTIVTYGLMRQMVEALIIKHKLSYCTVLDLRSIFPLDWAFIRDSVEYSRRLLIIEPDIAYGGVGAEIPAGFFGIRPIVAGLTRLIPAYLCP